MRRVALGIVAGCALLVVELAGRVFAGVPTVPELIQDRLVQLLPGPVFSFVLDRLLYLGKPLLFASLLLLQLLLAGVGGVLYSRWRQPVALAGLPWLMTGLLLLLVTGQGLFAGSVGVALVELLAFAAYAAGLEVYSTGRREHSAPATDGGASVEAPSDRAVADRRVVIGGSLTFLASLLLGRQIVGTLPSLPPRAVSTPDSSSPSSPALSTPAAAPAAETMVTPPSDFYVVSKNLIDPVVDASTWQLSVGGLVSHSLRLSYADILRLPAQDTYRTLECISNEVGGDLISNGLWTGVRLADVLKLAGVQSRAMTVHFTSVDGYTENMSLAKALDPSTLLAYKLDGQPLPSKHGFPLRVLGTGTYGMKNPKWLTRIDVVETGQPGFWESQGWNEQAIVQTMSRIDQPPDGAVLRAATTVIQGIAFAGSRGIQRVEVSTDGGTSWKPAVIQQPLSSNTWVFWHFTWQPPRAGSYTLVVRATDGTGQVQTSRQTDTYPDGATGYHQVDVRVAV